MRLNRSTQSDDAAFMSYIPLVSALLDEADCRNCRDYDALAYERRQKLAIEAPGTVAQDKSDLVFSIDALDDLEPGQIDVYLDEIASMTGKLTLIVVHRSFAAAVASHPTSWLLKKVGDRFDLIHFQDCEKGLLILACPSGEYAKLNAVADLAALARTTKALAPRESLDRKVARWVEVAKKGVEVRWLAFWDERTPWAVKAIAVMACLVAVSPIDFTPDVIPGVGFLDDLAILALGTIVATRLLQPELIASLRGRAASIDHSRAVRGSFAIGAIWVLAIMVTILHAWRPVI